VGVSGFANGVENGPGGGDAGVAFAAMASANASTETAVVKRTCEVCQRGRPAVGMPVGLRLPESTFRRINARPCPSPQVWRPPQRPNRAASPEEPRLGLSVGMTPVSLEENSVDLAREDLHHHREHVREVHVAQLPAQINRHDVRAVAGGAKGVLGGLSGTFRSDFVHDHLIRLAR
jgi:hypothetical protein